MHSLSYDYDESHARCMCVSCRYQRRLYICTAWPVHRQATALLHTRPEDATIVPPTVTTRSFSQHKILIHTAPGSTRRLLPIFHFTLCREQRAHRFPTNLDVALACDAGVPAAASMIAITPQP